MILHSDNSENLFNPIIIIIKKTRKNNNAPHLSSQQKLVSRKIIIKDWTFAFEGMRSDFIKVAFLHNLKS